MLAPFPLVGYLFRAQTPRVGVFSPWTFSSGLKVYFRLAEHREFAIHLGRPS